jgi:hypothetical protein
MNPYPSDPAVSGYVTTLTPLTEEVHGLEHRFFIDLEGYTIMQSND